MPKWHFEVTNNSRLLDEFCSEARKDPWTFFSRHRQKEVREALLEIIQTKKPEEAPEGWLQAAIKGLVSQDYEHHFGERILEWYILFSDKESVGQALSFAIELSKISRSAAVSNSIETSIVKGLDRVSDLGNRWGTELYWTVSGLRDYLHTLLFSIARDSRGDLRSSYRLESWNSTLKALNQITQAEDTSFLPALEELLGQYESGELKPNLGEDRFKTYTAIDHLAILRGRIAHLKAAEKEQKWDDSFLREKIQAFGIKDFRIETKVSASSDGRQHVYTSIEADDSTDLEVIRLGLRKIKVHVWSDGLCSDGGTGEGFCLQDSGVLWSCHLTKYHEVGRLWIGYSAGDNYFQADKNKKAIYL